VEVEARDLRKRFGRSEVLRGLDFRIPVGRRVALVGPNGSGKSTLIRVLLGLLRYRGHVRVGGCDPLAEHLAVAARMAYVPQIAPQLAAPVGELVRALSRLRGVPTEATAEVAEALALPLEGVWRQPFRSLSGGMKQKLLVALALGSGASLLVLDEPTGSLDPHSRERVLSLFERLASDTTVVLCSHRLEEVRQLVDHVLVLEEGRLRYDGSAAAFLASITTSVLEVCVEDAAAGRWLAARGFRRGTGRWWLRTVSQDEKLKLVPEIAAELGGSLSDLNVRDLESPHFGEPR